MPLRTMRDVAKYFRANPQVFVLLLVCLILGLGTFLAVVFGLVTAGNSTTNGEPSGSLATPLFHVASAVP